MNWSESRSCLAWPLRLSGSTPRYATEYSANGWIIIFFFFLPCENAGTFCSSENCVKAMSGLTQLLLAMAPRNLNNRKKKRKKNRPGFSWKKRSS